MAGESLSPGQLPACPAAPSRVALASPLPVKATRVCRRPAVPSPREAWGPGPGQSAEAPARARPG